MVPDAQHTLERPAQTAGRFKRPVRTFDDPSPQALDQFRRQLPMQQLYADNLAILPRAQAIQDARIGGGPVH